MIIKTNELKTKEGRTFKLKQRLTCKDYGIYVAQCKVCNETYVGQTATSFSTRWNGHRSTWKRLKLSCNKEKKNKIVKDNCNEKETKPISDEQALFEHYQKNHENEIKKMTMELPNAYNVIFVEKPSKYNLDTAEKFWIAKLKSKINICN